VHVAIYRLSAKVGKKGKACPHFNYISANGKYDKKSGVVHVEHGNMPPWSTSHPSVFWLASDAFERANGTVYREIEVALPRELSLSQQIKLTKQLAEEVCGKNHAYSYAIHHSVASDGQLNPHTHLMFSERLDDGHERDPQRYFMRANKKKPSNGGCLKDRSWQATRKGSQTIAQTSERLLEVRKSWEMMCNQYLADFEIDEHIDCRSYADREMDLTPQPKIGAKSWHQYQRTGVMNERLERREKVALINQPIMCNLAKLQIQKTEHQQDELIEEKLLVSKKLNELRNQRPIIHSLDEITTALLPRVSQVKTCRKHLTDAKSKLALAKQRYDKYHSIVDAPFRWGNIKDKIKCWLDHGTREGESMRLNEATGAYQEVRLKYDTIITRATDSMVVKKKAQKLFAGEQSSYEKWLEQIYLLQQSLSSVESNLEDTRYALATLIKEHSNLKPMEQPKPLVNKELHPSPRSPGMQ